MTEYKRPLHVDPTRYQQSEQVLKAMSTTDEYFVEEKPEDPLVLVVETLLSVLPEDERACVEMCIMAGISQHQAAITLGYINSNGKEDHKKVSRRLVWALRKMKSTLESPSFVSAMIGDHLPIDVHAVNATETLANIIKSLEEELGEDINGD